MSDLHSSMPWLETHLHDLDGALRAINKYGWNLEIGQKGDLWRVTTGGKEMRVVFQSPSKEAVGAFIYGMGLAAVTVPVEYALRQAKRKQQSDSGNAPTEK